MLMALVSMDLKARERKPGAEEAKIVHETSGAGT